MGYSKTIGKAVGSVANSSVVTETLGRNAAKVEEIDTVLGDLEAALVSIFPEGTYNRIGREDLKCGKPPASGITSVTVYGQPVRA